MIRSTLRRATAVLAAVALSFTLAPSAGAVGNIGDFHYLTHIRNVGWSDYQGTVGQGLPLEAIRARTWGGKKLCLRAHVQNIGWQDWKCTDGQGGSIQVGTTGQALQLEAVQLYSPNHLFSVRAHVANIGWQPYQTVRPAGSIIEVGTTGRGLAIEAIDIF